MPAGDARTDSELIDAAKTGDIAAFEALYHRHKDWVLQLAYRFTGNRDDALEALQESFAYLLRKLPGLRLTARLTTFLYPVVKHTAQAAARKTRRHRSNENEPEVAMGETMPSTDTQRIELATALAGLPEEQRETLLMRYVDDLSINEIAEALAIPPGTVKSRLHNALQSLKQDRRAQHYFNP